jgi:hypothetical protein
VLEAVRYALETDRWNRYTPLAARLLEAETLIQLRRFSEALGLLSFLPQNSNASCLKLKALKGLDDREAFGKVMAAALETYPRDPRPVRMLFEYAADRLPMGRDEEPIALALKRLPFLIEVDPELAYLGTPFIGDTGEARRLVGAYRAIHTPVPSSIPIALNLGILDGKTAIDEFFRNSPGTTEKKLDKGLLEAIWHLLRDDTERDYFKKQLVGFSGLITGDADKDGFVESQVWYEQGIVTAYRYDADQDGLPELTIFFEAGVPMRAAFVLAPDAVQGGKTSIAYPLKDEERVKGILQWEQFPAVLETKLEGVVYKPKPFEFFFFPIYFKRLEGGVLWYPERDPLKGSLAHQTLISSSILVEMPSREFAGAIEQVYLDRGVPQRAYERLDGRIISETSFHLGSPLIQRVDLDLNGYLETVRHFRRSGPGFSVPSPGSGSPISLEEIIEFSESDWDGNGSFEYSEQYPREESGVFDYRVIRSWDINRNGVQRFSEQNLYSKR